MGPWEVGKIFWEVEHTTGKSWLGGWKVFGMGKGGWKRRKVYILIPNINPGPGGFEVLCPKYHSERFNLKIDWKRKMLYVFDVAALHFLGFM